MLINLTHGAAGGAGAGRSGSGEFPQPKNDAPGPSQSKGPKAPCCPPGPSCPPRATAAAAPNGTNVKLGRRKVSRVNSDAYCGQVILPSLPAWEKLSLAHEHLTKRNYLWQKPQSYLKTGWSPYRTQAPGEAEQHISIQHTPQLSLPHFALTPFLFACLGCFWLLGCLWGFVLVWFISLKLFLFPAWQTPGNCFKFPVGSPALTARSQSIQHN